MWFKRYIFFKTLRTISIIIDTLDQQDDLVCKEFAKQA